MPSYFWVKFPLERLLFSRYICQSEEKKASGPASGKFPFLHILVYMHSLVLLQGLSESTIFNIIHSFISSFIQQALIECYSVSDIVLDILRDRSVTNNNNNNNYYYSTLHSKVYRAFIVRLGIVLSI